MMHVSERVAQLSLEGSRQRIAILCGADSRDIVDSFLLDHPTARVYVFNMSGESRWGNPEMNQGRLQFVQAWGEARLLRALSVLPHPDLIVDASGLGVGARARLAAALLYTVPDGGHYVSFGEPFEPAAASDVEMIEAEADITVFRKIGNHYLTLRETDVAATLDAALGTAWGHHKIAPSGSFSCYQDVVVSPSGRVALGRYIVPTPFEEQPHDESSEITRWVPVADFGSPVRELIGAYFQMAFPESTNSAGLSQFVHAQQAAWDAVRAIEPRVKLLVVGTAETAPTLAQPDNFLALEVSAHDIITCTEVTSIERLYCARGVDS